MLELNKESILDGFEEIILHCAATPEGKGFSAKTISRWHLQSGIVKPKVLQPPYNNIGYHLLVRLDGTIERGRPFNMEGSHCKDAGKNHSSLGISYVGGMTSDNKKAKDTRNDAQKKSIDYLLRRLKELYPQLKYLSGHNKYANKECPSFDVNKEYQHMDDIFILQ